MATPLASVSVSFQRALARRSAPAPRRCRRRRRSRARAAGRRGSRSARPRARAPRSAAIAPVAPSQPPGRGRTPTSAARRSARRAWRRQASSPRRLDSAYGVGRRIEGGAHASRGRSARRRARAQPSSRFSVVPAFSRTARAGSWRAPAGSGTPAKCSTASQPAIEVARGRVAGVDAHGVELRGRCARGAAPGGRAPSTSWPRSREQRRRPPAEEAGRAGDEDPHRARYSATLCSYSQRRCEAVHAAPPGGSLAARPAPRRRRRSPSRRRRCRP